MKAFADFFPVLLFFAVYWASRDMFLATGAAIAASVAFTGYAWFRHRRVETMQWVSLGLIVVLGGATLLFHDKHFIMWKPTALYWLITGALLAGELTGKNGIRALLGKQMELPDDAWRLLNRAWMAFFAFMGGLNLWVAYSFSEATWVNFKLFGGIGLMLVFAIGQSFYLSKYQEERE
ncbi:septation protein A [Crenobacter cavernae]|uniref:Inner membrane-spanning protein YciB n=1 Tax=Crenobacter cavernae TaxID=2290923 RepID=A0ABY0FDQ0_9NEIS|nr:septation protein A [Crenobacter cavernae]RXZ42182.1 septation protein A [Crenobacter cavernae]